jgi:hypothetical protein
MRPLKISIAALAVVSFACSLFVPPPTPTYVPATNTPQPPTIAVPPPATPPEPGYLLQEERLINGYAVRLWKNPGDQPGYDSILMLEAANQAPIRVDMVSAINDLTGTDLNADGFPDLVVETYSGGAHCCFGTQVFSLRPSAAALILHKPESNAGGTFENLNADTIPEFVTYDDSFAYQYCPYAAGVQVKAIMAYDPAQERYLPASPRFPEQYKEEIATNEERAQYPPGELGEWDGTNICAILPLTLDYFYMGQPEQAKSEFYSRYSGPDADAKWNEIVQVVENSSLYTP